MGDATQKEVEAAIQSMEQEEEDESNDILVADE